MNWPRPLEASAESPEHREARREARSRSKSRMPRSRRAPVGRGSNASSALPPPHLDVVVSRRAHGTEGWGRFGNGAPARRAAPRSRGGRSPCSDGLADLRDSATAVASPPWRLAWATVSTPGCGGHELVELLDAPAPRGVQLPVFRERDAGPRARVPSTVSGCSRRSRLKHRCPDRPPAGPDSVTSSASTSMTRTPQVLRPRRTRPAPRSGSASPWSSRAGCRRHADLISPTTEPVSATGLDVDDPLAAAPLEPVLVEQGLLP